MRHLCARCLAPLPDGYGLRFCKRCRRETIEAYLAEVA